MASLAEIVARAEQIAVGRGIDPHDSPVLDAGLSVEALYPHALRYIILKDLRNGGNPNNYRRTINVPMVGGVGTLPDSVLREFMCVSYLPDESNSAHLPYDDYNRDRRENMLAYFSNKGASFYSSLPAAPEIPPYDEYGTFIMSGGSSTATASTPHVVEDFGARAIATQDEDVVFDGFIDPDLVNGGFVLRGEAINPAVSGNLRIHRSDKYTFNRNLTSVTTTSGSATIDCPGGNFTPADLYRRIQILSSAGAYIADGIIYSVVSPTRVSISVQANASAAGTATATIMDSDVILGVIEGVSSTAGNRSLVPAIGLDARSMAKFVGHRLWLADSGLSATAIDAIIGAFPTNTSIRMQGTALFTAPGTGGVAVIYRADHYAALKNASDASTNLANENVTSTVLAGIDIDINRRMTIYKSGVLVVDSFVTDVSGTTFVLGARPLTTETNADATILTSGVPLSVPALPDEPIDSTTDLGLSPKLEADVIVTMAAAIIGDIRLPELITAQ